MTLGSKVHKVFKIVLAGNGGVGKTTLAKVFCDNPYIDQLMTIGVDIHAKDALIDGEMQTMQIWDLSGQVQFRFMLEGFISSANGIILGFDVTRVESFHDLGAWLEILRSGQPDVPILLIATKTDLEPHPEISEEKIQNFVEQNNLKGFIKTSAKSGINVNAPFEEILCIINELSSGEGSVVILKEEPCDE